MEQIKILIADKIDEEAITILQSNGFIVDMNFLITKQELEEKIENYDAIIVRSRTKLTRDLLEKAKRLKIIGRAGVGVDNIDVEHAEKLNIKVVNTPEAPSISVAELTIGLLISLVRNISIIDKKMHCGEWCKNDYIGFELKNKRIGLIGFGNIGQAVAKRAEAFEMKIGIYDVDPIVKQKAMELGYEVFPSVDELVQKSQIISLHVPSTVKTENTINEKRLSLMNKDALIINTARGNLIDENALLKALKNKTIAGAALDVYRKEPFENLDLCNCEENLILTPHIGSQTIETQKNASRQVCMMIKKFLEKS